MPNNIIKTKHLLKGDKGDRGSETGIDTTVPLTALIAFDGKEIPEGYELYEDTEGGE